MSSQQARGRGTVPGLGPWVDEWIVLDGGPCAAGIESTVVDATVTPPQVLRPGMLRIDPAAASVSNAAPAGPARSPGQRLRHDAPTEPLWIVGVALGEPARHPGEGGIELTADAERAVAMLAAELRRHEADPAVERIVVREPPVGPAWGGIRDRLRRAASD